MESDTKAKNNRRTLRVDRPHVVMYCVNKYSILSFYIVIENFVIWSWLLDKITIGINLEFPFGS